MQPDRAKQRGHALADGVDPFPGGCFPDDLFVLASGENAEVERIGRFDTGSQVLYREGFAGAPVAQLDRAADF
jgi:hypothetical protein